jgi:hypothetical protein
MRTIAGPASRQFRALSRENSFILSLSAECARKCGLPRVGDLGEYPVRRFLAVMEAPREFVDEKILRELSAAFWRHAKLAGVQHGAVGYGSSLISLRPEVMGGGKLSSYSPRKIKKARELLALRAIRANPFGTRTGAKILFHFQNATVVQTSQEDLIIGRGVSASGAFLLRDFSTKKLADRRLPTARVQWLCNKFSRARARRNQEVDCFQSGRFGVGDGD